MLGRAPSSAHARTAGGAAPSAGRPPEPYARGSAGFRVCVVDPAPLAAWPNNYGVWADEFEAMGLDDCLEVVWPQAVVHLDDGARFGSRCGRRARLLRPG